jgi:voltage-gated potassium channel
MPFLKTLFFGKNLSNHRSAHSPLYRERASMKAIWNNYHYNDAGIEKLLRLALAFSQFMFPGIYIKHLFWRFGNLYEDLSIDVYVLFKMLFPLIILYNGLQSYSIGGFSFFIFIPVYFLLETVFHVSTLVLASDIFSRPRSYRRAVLLLFFNFLEIVFDFAVLYSSGHHVNPAFEHLIDPVYFSFTTSTTIGFGDYTPISTVARILVICQALIYLLFLVLFVNVFANRIEQKGYFGKENDK